MVIISHQSKFIFIHIPKTCGQTIKNNLPFDASGNCSYYGFKNLEPKCWSKGRYRNLYHLKYQEIHEVYPDLQLNKYFIFSFVRNPYDRVYSMYLYCKKHLVKEICKIILTLSVLLTIIYVLYYSIIYIYQGNLPKFYNLNVFILFIFILILLNIKNIQLFYKLYQCNFNDFITKHIQSIYKLSPYILDTQTEYLKGCKPNFIGREERFNEDFTRLRNILGIEEKPLDSINIINKRKDNSLYKYIDKFTPQTIKIVNHIYHDDFIQFGYDKIHYRKLNYSNN